MKRRSFLKTVAVGSVSTSFITSKLLAESNTLNTISFDDNEFKAIVTIFLSGGNDSVNMLVPYHEDKYSDYKEQRPSLAIPRENLNPLNPEDVSEEACATHPYLPKINQMYRDKKLAFVANVGTLVKPTTQEEVIRKTAILPPHLFAHGSQRDIWASCQPFTLNKTGWAGRLSDEVTLGEDDFPFNQSIKGKNLWQKGIKTQPYIYSVGGVKQFGGFTTKFSATTKAVVEDISNITSENPLLNAYTKIQQSSISKSRKVTAALAGVTLNTNFPDNPINKKRSYLMQQVRMLSRVLKQKSLLSNSTNKGTYYIEQSGYDSHANQTRKINNAYQDLDDAVYSLSQALEELGLTDKVTVICMSDFGRSVGNNNGGTGHGWGGHYFTFGGAVKGGKIYGDLPDLSKESKDLVLHRRLLPTTSTEQYFATVTKWFGLSDAENLGLFPNLKNFPEEKRDLGFMG
ncbi:DUF1501 domain-containing protein [Sulfurovum sp. bin170]|uniref:DUF1501 domain-containing protein n=1 Tax=Sulfurovum sp. bin170 TaxID=2695268 RepID=UPI0013DF2831|nr:DUF1501 domain-containing protein [Sulfurovum sp. bin170]NEW60753.1 DUF1501 domain-containing protein [Sulfurovum sp. bin170]